MTLPFTGASLIVPGGAATPLGPVGRDRLVATGEFDTLLTTDFSTFVFEMTGAAFADAEAFAGTAFAGTADLTVVLAGFAVDLVFAGAGLAFAAGLLAFATPFFTAALAAGLAGALAGLSALAKALATFFNGLDLATGLAFATGLVALATTFFTGALATGLVAVRFATALVAVFWAGFAGFADLADFAAGLAAFFTDFFAATSSASCVESDWEKRTEVSGNIGTHFVQTIILASDIQTLREEHNKPLITPRARQAIRPPRRFRNARQQNPGIQPSNLPESDGPCPPARIEVGRPRVIA